MTTINLNEATFNLGATIKNITPFMNKDREIRLEGEFLVVAQCPLNPEQRRDGYNLIITHMGLLPIYPRDAENWEIVSD